MTEAVLRLFVPPESIVDGRLELRGDHAARAYQRGARAGRALVVLDDSGWETLVEIDNAQPDLCEGRTTDRSLANERRTKINVYHALLHPADFRRLLKKATVLGVAGIVPVIADRSVVPTIGADGRVTGQSEWERLVRDAAEESGRGRRPSVGQPTLFSHAVDAAARSGTVFLIHPGGLPAAEVASSRPFSVDLFCPPPGGFTDEERTWAEARGVIAVAPDATGWDPVEQALVVVEQLYANLE